MKRIRIDLQYDGTGFHGWQRQPSKGATVQGLLESHLRDVLDQPELDVTGQGRTDAGAHALFQVAHFDCEMKIPAERLPYVMNRRLLDHGVQIIAAREVDFSFHARYSALSRTYCYLLYQSEQRPPVFLARYCHYVPRQLDLRMLEAGLSRLLGQHDFAAFCDSDWEGQTTVREVLDASVVSEGPFVFAVFKANAFLHKMVRHTVGLLLEIGRRRLSPEIVTSLLNNPHPAVNAKRPWQLPPAKGLFLVNVEYPPEA